MLGSTSRGEKGRRQLRIGPATSRRRYIKNITTTMASIIYTIIGELIHFGPLCIQNGRFGALCGMRCSFFRCMRAVLCLCDCNLWRNSFGVCALYKLQSVRAFLALPKSQAVVVLLCVLAAQSSAVLQCLRLDGFFVISTDAGIPFLFYNYSSRKTPISSLFIPTLSLSARHYRLTWHTDDNRMNAALFTTCV